MADAIPGISQFKSFCQYMCGDSKGALETQVNFSKQCPVVAQVRSACEALSGQPGNAKNTQVEFVKEMANTANSIPGIGHVKGLLHYCVGDREGGDNAMKAASRKTAVIGGGLGAATMVACPLAAVAGGIIGGLAMDIVTTKIDSAVHGENRPSGYLKQLENISKNPDPGQVFDFTLSVVTDGTTGYMAKNKLEGYKKRKKLEEKRQILEKEVGKEETQDIVQAADELIKTREKYNIPNKKPHTTALVRDLETNKTYTGHNKQVRDHCMKVDGEEDDQVQQMANLEKKDPNVKPPLHRRPDACAEHHAYKQLYEDRPDANPENTRVSTVEFRKSTGKTQTKKRCANCKAYGSLMGSAPTDELDNVEVPINPRVSKREHLRNAGEYVIMSVSVTITSEDESDSDL